MEAIPQRSGPRNWHPKYEAALNLMVAKPTLAKGKIAEELGVTPAWLSVIINSDMFRARLAERQEALASKVADSISDKMVEAVDLAMDKTIDRLRNNPEDSAFISTTRDSLLSRLGYIKSERREQDVNINANPAQSGWMLLLKQRGLINEAGEAIEADFEDVESHPEKE